MGFGRSGGSNRRDSCGLALTGAAGFAAGVAGLAGTGAALARGVAAFGRGVPLVFAATGFVGIGGDAARAEAFGLAATPPAVFADLGFNEPTATATRLPPAGFFATTEDFRDALLATSPCLLSISLDRDPPSVPVRHAAGRKDLQV
jgi:hypothetical protein